MTPRALATLALFVVMAQAASVRSVVFSWSMAGGIAGLLLRYMLVPRILGLEVTSRLRWNLNLGLVVVLWVAALTQILTQILPADLIAPMAVAAGVWFLLDQPPARIVDTFYIGLVCLIAIVSPLVLPPTDAMGIAAIGASGVILVASFGALDRSRLEEFRTRETAPIRVRSELPAFLGLSVLSICIGLSLPLHLAMDDTERSGESANRSTNLGFGDSLELGSMASFFPADAEMLLVRIRLEGKMMKGRMSRLNSRSMLFRGQVLDQFDGIAFRRASPEVRVPRDREISKSRRTWFLEVDQEISHESLGFSHLYGLTTVRPKSRAGLVRRGGRGEVLADGPRVSAVGRYRVLSWVLDAQHRRRLAGEGVPVDRRRQYLDAYLGLGGSGEATREWEALAIDVTGAARGDFAKVQALQSFFVSEGGFTYSRNPPLGSMKPLDRFLLHSRTGYCEHFASAMAVMLRTLGIPSRVVRGFRGGAWSPARQGYRILGQDAHAWVEVPFEGVGWISFDPTPASTRLDVAADGRPIGGDEGGEFVGVGAPVAGLLSEGLTNQTAPYLVLAVMTVMLLLFWSVARRKREHRHRASGDASSLGLASRLARLLYRAGARRREPATLQELLDDAGQWPGEERGSAAAVIRLLYRARFGALPMSSTETLGVREFIARLEARMSGLTP